MNCASKRGGHCSWRRLLALRRAHAYIAGRAAARRPLSRRLNRHERHDLCRRGPRAAAQDRTDQDPRPRRLRRHAQGRARWRPNASTCSPARSGRASPPSAIDRLSTTSACDHGALPATLMYRGYRKSTCTSINHVVCHGIPGEKPLREGDIVNVDVTLDPRRLARRFEPHVRGRRNPAPRRAADRSHLRGDDARHRRDQARRAPPATSAHAIQTYVEAQHMSVVRDFCGHGLGRLFHDEPNIVHVGRPGEGIVLKPGMFFTVEPMINLGRPHVKVLSDGWTAVTRDRSLSAQFEHSVGGHRDGRRDLHPLARRASTGRPTRRDRRAALARAIANCADSGHPVGADAQGGGTIASRVRSPDVRPGQEAEAPASPSAAALSRPSRAACARASAKPARRRSPTTSCWSWCCSAPCPGATSSRSPRALIATFGSFAEVIAAPPQRLREVNGFGDAAITELKIVQAAAQPARARARCRSGRSSPHGRACSTIAAPPWPSPSSEQFRVLFLDKRNQLIADEVQQIGTVDHTPVYPREVVKRALELSATAIILVHNHPSGDPTPSRADIADDAGRSSRSPSRSASPCTTTSSSARKATRASRG